MAYSIAIDSYYVNARESQLKVVQFCLILALVLFAVPAYFYLEAEDFRFDNLSTLFLLIIAGSSLMLAAYGASANPRPISITFYAFVYVFLGMSPLLQVGLRQYPWGGGYDEVDIQKSAVTIAAGVIAYFFGTKIAQQMHRKFHDPHSVARGFDAKKVLLLSLVFVPVVLGCMQYLGGVARLFTPRLMQDELAELTSVTAALANNGMYVPCIAFFLIFLSTMLSVKRGEKNYGWSRIGTALWLLIALVIANPIGTPRYIVGAVVVAILYFNTLRRAWIWPIFLVFSLLLIFPLADMFRSSLTVTTEHMPPAYEQIVFKPDFDAFQQIVNSIKYVEQRGMEGGLQALGTILFFVPREAWPDKPFATGQLVGDAMGYTMLNLSMPLWGEFYVDGGILAVCIGFVLYGMFTGAIEESANASAFRGMAGVLSVFFGAYQMYFLRGSLMVVISYFIPFICLFALCWALCRTAPTTSPALATCPR